MQKFLYEVENGSDYQNPSHPMRINQEGTPSNSDLDT